MFALFCIFLVIGVLGAWYIGDYYGKREAERRKADEENAQTNEGRKTTTFYPCGARVINEKGEVIGTLYRGSAIMLHFLLAHKDKKLSTAELHHATGISEAALLPLQTHGWILCEKNDNDYYRKVLLTEKGKQLFLEAL